MKKISLLFIVLALFFAYGCIKKDFAATRMKSAGDISVQKVELRADCSAFTCEEKTGLLESFKSFLPEGFIEQKPALEDCRIEKIDTSGEAGKAAVEKLLSFEDDFKLRMFMFGAGPSIAVTDELRKYCEGNLGIAVQWLGGNKVESARSVDVKQVSCATESDLIPLLAYGITSGDLGYTISLSKNLMDKGPVFVAPGALYSRDNPDHIDPSCDFAIVKSRCPNCLTTAFIRFGDEKTLDWFNQKQNVLSSASECNAFVPMEKIDVVAVDVNLSDFECDSDSPILDAMTFVESAANKYKKPSILYVHGGQNKGKDGCSWTTDKLKSLHTKLYSFAPFFLSSGVIAIVNGDPAIFDQEGKQSVSFKSWIEGCRFYYDQTVDRPALIPLLFPYGGSESTCSKGKYELSFLYQPSIKQESPGYKPLYKPNRCDGDECADEKVLEDAGNPAIVIPADSDQVYQVYCASWNVAVRQFSGQFFYDPSVVRSIMQSESSFARPLEPKEEFEECSQYVDATKKMCNGVLALAKYQKEAMIKTGADMSKSPSSMHIYFSIIGYKNGRSRFDTELSRYRGNPGSYVFDQSILQTIANAAAFRSACGIC